MAKAGYVQRMGEDVEVIWRSNAGGVGWAETEDIVSLRRKVRGDEPQPVEVDDLEDGAVYKVQAGHGRTGGRFGVLVVVGAKVVDVGKEAERLQGLASEVKQYRTGQPGVKGYQHLENMTNSRTHYSRMTSGRLARWLADRS